MFTSDEKMEYGSADTANREASLPKRPDPDIIEKTEALHRERDGAANETEADRRRRLLMRYALGDLAAGLFCTFFGAIYEHFSHEVYSPFMIYAGIIPIAAGVLPLLLLAVRNGGRCRTEVRHPKNALLSLQAWHAGIAALTVGCVFQGVLEIYGTTNRLITVYPVTAAVCMIVSIVFSMPAPVLRRQEDEGNTQVL